MSDFLSREERRLIDQAIAEGKVEKVPPGTSAWMTVEGVTLTPSLTGRPRQRAEAVIARRKYARQIIRENPQIDPGLVVKALQRNPLLEPVGKTTLEKDVRFVMGTASARTASDKTEAQLRGLEKTERVKRRRSVEKAAKRRVDVQRLVCEGKSKTEIIRILSTNWATLNRDLDALGLTCVSKQGQGNQPPTHRRLK